MILEVNGDLCMHVSSTSPRRGLIDRKPNNRTDIAEDQNSGK